MGVESTIYFVNNRFGIRIAALDICKMNEYGFADLFYNKYKHGLYSEFGGMTGHYGYEPEDGNKVEIPDVAVFEDRYGTELHYAYIDDLYQWLKANRKRLDYRRTDMLYKMVKEFRKVKWKSEDVVAVLFQS